MSFEVRDRPRFFDQVGHQTIFAYIGNSMDNGCVIRTKNHETSKVVGFWGMSVGCPDKIHLC